MSGDMRQCRFCLQIWTPRHVCDAKDTAIRDLNADLAECKAECERLSNDVVEMGGIVKDVCKERDALKAENGRLKRCEIETPQTRFCYWRDHVIPKVTAHRDAALAERDTATRRVAELEEERDELARQIDVWRTFAKESDVDDVDFAVEMQNAEALLILRVGALEGALTRARKLVHLLSLADAPGAPDTELDRWAREAVSVMLIIDAALANDREPGVES